jgi:hypothetical protein
MYKKTKTKTKQKKNKKTKKQKTKNANISSRRAAPHTILQDKTNVK